MVDVNQPVSNPALVAILNKMQQEPSASNELVLIDEIKQAHYLTPIILDGEIEDGMLKAGSTISFKTIANGAGESFFMAFTDWDELAKCSTQPEQTLISTYDDLKAMVLNDTNAIQGFVINPHNHSLVITPELMKYFDTRATEIIMPEETQIMLGQPANYPHEMVAALAAFFKGRPDVARAYLFLAQKVGEAANLLLIIDFQGEKSALFPQTAAVAQDYLGPDEYIDLVPLDSDFGRDATRDATPFYQREA